MNIKTIVMLRKVRLGYIGSIRFALAESGFFYRKFKTLTRLRHQSGNFCVEPGTASLARDPDPTQSLDKNPEN